MSVKLKPITETSWLVLGDTEDTRIGLLTEIRNQYVLMVKGEKQQFVNRKEVNKFFDEDVFENVVEPIAEENIKKNYFINGYPVDYEETRQIISLVLIPVCEKKAPRQVLESAKHTKIQIKAITGITLCVRSGLTTNRRNRL